MAENDSVVLGKFYETFVKRGMLAYLVNNDLLNENMLSSWAKTSVKDVFSFFSEEIDQVDIARREAVEKTFSYLSFLGQYQGYTAIRYFFRSISSRKKDDESMPRLVGIWCLSPFEELRAGGEDSEQLTKKFAAAFGVAPDVHGLTAKGKPARADFMLWIKAGEKNHIFVAEISLSASIHRILDYDKEEVHLKIARVLEKQRKTRGMFSMIKAEVNLEENLSDKFQFSSRMSDFLDAFATEDKPLYKLCQGASYAHEMIRVLKNQKQEKNIDARIIAVTSGGLESIFASTRKPETMALLEDMGKAYQNAQKSQNIAAKINDAINCMVSHLPVGIQEQIEKSLGNDPVGKDYEAKILEVLECPDSLEPSDFFRQSYEFCSPDEALVYLDKGSKDFLQRNQNHSHLETYRDIREAMAKDLKQNSQKEQNSQKVSLRGLHKAAVVAAMKSSVQGQVKVLGLTGSPGIGKTTAMKQYLRDIPKEEGYLFVYMSPRVMINNDVFSDIEGSAIAITCNAKINSKAQSLWKSYVEKYEVTDEKQRKVERAVIYETEREIKVPEENILFLRKEEWMDLDKKSEGDGFSALKITEEQIHIKEQKRPGVMDTAFYAVHQIMERNPDVNRIVLTMAIQGFKSNQGNTPMEAFNRIFGSSKKAIEHGMEAFFSRIPHIIVMIDELAGDGAGAPLAHSIAKWMETVANKYYGKKWKSPHLTIVLADASLTNAGILQAYLEGYNGLDADAYIPSRMLISRGDKSAFSVDVRNIRVGETKKNVITIAVNCFPSKEKLRMEYWINFRTFLYNSKNERSEIKEIKKIQKEKREIYDQYVISAISDALRNESRQVIYFAQDIDHLKGIQQQLEKKIDKPKDKIITITSKMGDKEREKLVGEEGAKRRDDFRVILMTSSAARGISFPMADTIIASVPTFQIENALMEIVQLIYRGRGQKFDGTSGDDVQRRLVFLVQDFLIINNQVNNTDVLRAWIKRFSDLITVMMLVRGSVLTRIKGDAGVQKPIAIVPVGDVVVDRVEKTLSACVKTFLKELMKSLRSKSIKSIDENHVGLIMTTKELILHVLKKYIINLQNKPKQKSGYSFVAHNEFLPRFYLEQHNKDICLGKLLPDKDTIGIADELDFIGPVIIEQPKYRDFIETFHMDSSLLDGIPIPIDKNTPVEEAVWRCIERLRNNLGKFESLFKNEDGGWEKNRDLIEAAHNLYKIFKEATKSPLAVKKFNAESLFFVVPTGGVFFEQKRLPYDNDVFNFFDIEQNISFYWKTVLSGLVVHNNNFSSPPVPNYKDIIPWFSGCSKDPCGTNIIFSNRFFAASTEMNFLNILLL